MAKKEFFLTVKLNSVIYKCLLRLKNFLTQQICLVHFQFCIFHFHKEILLLKIWTNIHIETFTVSLCMLSSAFNYSQVLVHSTVMNSRPAIGTYLPFIL